MLSRQSAQIIANIVNMAKFEAEIDGVETPKSHANLSFGANFRICESKIAQITLKLPVSSAISTPTHGITDVTGSTRAACSEPV